MADRHGDARLAQLLDDIALGDIRALHLVAELVHHFGDARHADAADADEMDRADVGTERLHHAGTPPTGASALVRGVSAGPTTTGATPLPTRSTRSARSRAAWGRPTESARAAALLSATGSIASASICRARRSGVKFSCLIARAPPAFTISRALAVWWSSVAAAKGTRMAGRPAAVSSAIVEAPARPIIRWQSASF